MSNLFDKLGEVGSKVFGAVTSHPELAGRVLDLALAIFNSKDPLEAAKRAEEAALKESYRHGFEPTPDRKPVG